MSGGAIRICANCGERHAKARCPACGSALKRDPTTARVLSYATAQPQHGYVDHGGFSRDSGCYWTPPVGTYDR